jgi:small-conductance mechanosensitive channel
MDPFSYAQTGLERLAAWLLADILTAPILAQVPAVALTGAGAWLVTRPLRRLICGWIDRTAQAGGWWGRHGGWVADRLVPLVAPAAWAAGLWVAVAVAQRLAWPHDIARIAANLLAVWLAIRLAADLIPNRALARLVASAAWLLAALNILHLLEPLAELLDAAAINVGQLRVSVLGIIKGVVSLTILLSAATFVSRLFEQRITRAAELSPRARALFGKLLKITLVTLAVTLALTSVGFDLSTLAILGGAVGVGVGLGLQKAVSNLFAGFLLLLDKSIKPGDVIQVDQTYGWVTSLGARYVAVETRDGTQYLIPNEDIITKQVLNWSHKSTRVRLKVRVRAPLDADLDHVLALMKEAAGRPARILKTPAPNALVLGFGESAVELELRFWITDAPRGVQNVKSEALLEIWRLFRAHGIPVPRPARDVFMHAAPDRSGEASANEAVDLAAARAREALRGRPARSRSPAAPPRTEEPWSAS